MKSKELLSFLKTCICIIKSKAPFWNWYCKLLEFYVDRCNERCKRYRKCKFYYFVNCKKNNRVNIILLQIIFN